MWQDLLIYVKELNPNILFGLGLLGGSYYIINSFLSGIFTKISNIVYSVLSYRLHLHYSSPLFHSMEYWLQLHSKDLLFNKNLKLTRVMKGTLFYDILVPGYGKAWIKVKGYPLMIVEREEVEKRGQWAQTDNITIWFLFCLKRSVKKFIDTIKNIQFDDDKPQLYLSDGPGFTHSGAVREVLEPSHTNVRILENTIHKFIRSKQLYKKRKIPFKLGCILHGPPGTGKSSVVCWLANKFNLDVYSLSFFSSKIISEVAQSSKLSIILVEDIDLTSTAKKLRHIGLENKEKTPPISGMDVFMDDWSGDLLRDTLNSLDGIQQNSGLIFICTTNAIQNLDKALLRPGRLDEQCYLNQLNKQEQEHFLEAFFGEEVTLVQHQGQEMTTAELAYICRNNDLDTTIKILGVDKPD